MPSLQRFSYGEIIRALGTATSDGKTTNLFLLIKRFENNYQYILIDLINLVYQTYCLSLWDCKRLCLKFSVKLIDSVVIGTVSIIRSNPPRYKDKNPSFVAIRYSPWKEFLYPKTESSKLPPLIETSALWICILSLTISKGVVKKPASAEAVDEHKILLGSEGLFKLTKFFIFS